MFNESSYDYAISEYSDKKQYHCRPCFFIIIKPHGKPPPPIKNTSLKDAPIHAVSAPQRTVVTLSLKIGDPLVQILVTQHCLKYGRFEM